MKVEFFLRQQRDLHPQFYGTDHPASLAPFACLTWLTPALICDQWPNGLQEGLSQPVAVLINEGREIEEAANRTGYRYFTDVGTFRDYVRREVLAQAEVEA